MLNSISMTRSARRAFSLVEITMVLVIMAVIAGIAAPRYGDALHRYRIDAAARRVAADLSLAQSRARSTSESRSVAFNLSTNSYQVSGETALDSIGPYTVALAGEPYYVSIATVSFAGASSAVFNGYGVPASGGSIQLRCGGITRTISLEGESGTVSVQ